MKKEYDSQQIKVVRPILPSEIPDVKIDYRGLIKYADSVGKSVPELSDEEKNRFITGGTMAELKEYQKEKFGSQTQGQGEFDTSTAKAVGVSIAWDPDFTKVTPEERSRLDKADEEMKNGEYFTDDEVWK